MYSEAHSHRYATVGEQYFQELSLRGTSRNILYTNNFSIDEPVEPPG